MADEKVDRPRHEAQAENNPSLPLPPSSAYLPLPPSSASACISSRSAFGLVSPATAEDVAYVHSRLREMDAFEHEHCRAHCPGRRADELDLMEKAWTLRMGRRRNEAEAENSPSLPLPPSSPSASPSASASASAFSRFPIVGFVGLMLPPFASPMSTSRFVPMLSTTNVEGREIDYVRLSRPTLAFVVSQAPAWVADFFSAPFARYAASVKWHEKTMRWKRVGELDVFGEKAILFHLARKDVPEWKR